MQRFSTRWIVPVVVLLLLLPLSTAANDPGHDSLYVLKIGDSNVTGTINISANITATIVQATSRFFGPNLDLRGDGSSSAATNQLIGTNSHLELSSTGELILNKAVTGGWVYIGWPGTTTGLNVTGQIIQQGVNVCLSNGTNCPGNLGGANLTGSGSANYLSKWTSGTNLGTGLLYDTGSTIGISTITPAEVLHLNGNFRVGQGPATLTNLSDGSVNSTVATINVTSTTGYPTTGTLLIDNEAITYTGTTVTSFTGATRGSLGTTSATHASGAIVNAYLLTILTNSTSSKLIVTANGSVGVGTATPQTKLDVIGTVNATTFSGAGTALTGTAASLTAGTATTANQLGGQIPTVYLNTSGFAAENLTSGTIASGRLTGTYSISITGDASTLASQGANYYLNRTGFNAANITSGTLSVARGGTGVATGTGTDSVVLNNSPIISGTGTLIASTIKVGSNNVCQSDGTNCPIGAGSGWINGTTQVWLVNNATNISIGSRDGSPVLFIDNTNGRIGINTTTPRTQLELNGDGAILATGTVGAGWTEPDLGAGTRLLWYPRKAAFRAGEVSGTQWDDANIGDHSFAAGQDVRADGPYGATAMGSGTRAAGAVATALGYFTTAIGDVSTAMGYSTTASGQYATAMGFSTTASGTATTTMGQSTTASGQYATAMGYSTTASGDTATAMGESTTASGDHATAMGGTTTASGNAATAMGNSTTASGDISTAMGNSTTASGNYSTAMGESTIASGQYATAMGIYTNASSYDSVALGRYNIGGGTTGSWVTTDPLFEIGIGAGSSTSANALTVLKNGNVGIGTAYPNNNLNVVGVTNTTHYTIPGICDGTVTAAGGMCYNNTAANPHMCFYNSTSLSKVDAPTTHC